MIRNIIAITGLLLIPALLNATHIIGGYLEAQQTGANTYTIKCVLLRDCSPGTAAMPTSLNLCVFEQGTNILQQNLILTNPTLSNISLNDSCYSDSACIQQGVFMSTSITIPDFAPGYYITTEFFARTAITQNLALANATGLTLITQIPDPDLTSGNSTPMINGYLPNTFFCINTFKQISFSAVDPDGDSLVYTLDTPYDSNLGANGCSPQPYANIVWESSYSESNMIGGNNPLTMNATNGTLNPNPMANGLFTIGFIIEEFRNTIKIGESRYDFAIYAFDCSPCYLDANNYRDELVKMYPNPVDERLNIENFKFTTFRIVDLSGRLIVEENSTNLPFIEMPESLKSGCYILNLFNHNQTTQLKFIKN